MAKTKEIYVSVSRKISDGEYGSFGAECGILMEVGDEDDRTEVAVAGMSFASARVASTHKAHGTVPSPTEGVKAPVAKPAPVVQPALPSDGVVAGELTFPVETLSVEVKGGKRYVKAKGGHFTMYGVNVWEEIRKLPPLEWDEEYVNGLEGADYNAPNGLTAIYIEKEITTKDGVTKMVPDKVTGWK